MSRSSRSSLSGLIVQKRAIGLGGLILGVTLVHMRRATAESGDLSIDTELDPPHAEVPQSANKLTFED